MPRLNKEDSKVVKETHKLRLLLAEFNITLCGHYCGVSGYFTDTMDDARPMHIEFDSGLWEFIKPLMEELLERRALQPDVKFNKQGRI